MRGQKGFTLLETLIALTILAVIAVSIFFALNVSIKSTARVDHHTTAESLTRTVQEFIKSLAYDGSGSPDYQDEVDANIAVPPGYSIMVVAMPIDPDTYAALPPGEDDGLQKITVEIDYDLEEVMTTTSYKVQR